MQSSGGEGLLAKDGPLVVRTGKHTGRSRQGQVHRSRRRDRRHGLVGQDQQADGAGAFRRAQGRLPGRAGRARRLCSSPTCSAARSRSTACNVRVINELAWHNLFIRTLLVRPEAEELAGFVPEFTIIDLPSFSADPERHGCRSETVIAVNLTEKLILIGGTEYAGEMKKSVFGLLNYPAPGRRRHADALLGQHRPEGRHARSSSASSGTGKTTLSADAEPHADRRRRAWLVGHGGLQLRRRLLRQDDPPVGREPSRRSTRPPSASARCSRTWSWTRRPASSTSTSAAYAENSRGAYPIDFIPELFGRRTWARCRRTSSC